MTEVTEDQFAWDGDSLLHEPTGAKFHLRSQWVNYGRAGEELPDGSCYESEDVRAVANNMVVAERARRESS